MVFDDLAFFFYHQNFIQALREFANALGFQRPGHGHFVNPDADVGRHLLVDTEFIQGFQHIHVRLAAGDDAQPGLGAVHHGAVKPVGTRISDGGVNFVVLHQGFLGARLHAQGVNGQARMQPLRGHDKVLRMHDL